MRKGETSGSYTLILIIICTEMAELAAAELLLEAVPEVNTVLILCGFANPVDRARLVDGEDLDVLDSFGDFTDSLIDNMADRNEKRTPAAQRVRFGVQRILRLKAVAHWVRQKRREGVIPNIDELNIDVIRENVREMTIDSAADTKRDDKMFYPDKFNPKKYVSWARSFENYLDSVRGKAKVPLSYVIRPDGVNPADAVDEYQRILWQTPHTGIAYNEDNREVYRIYKDLMIATDGWTWFNRAPNGDGRAAHLIIEHHYRGDAETAVRAAEAEARLHRLHYRNESALPFEQYVTKISECFELMADNDQQLSEAQKVKYLLDGMISTNPDIIAIKAVVREKFPTNFNQASLSLAGQISRMYPASHLESRAKRKISAVQRDFTRNRNRNGPPYDPRVRNNVPVRPGARSGSPNGAVIANGVDLSDPLRTFTPEEWRRLREAGMANWVMDQRNRGRAPARGGRGPGRGGGGRSNAGRGGQQARVSVVRFQDTEDTASNLSMDGSGSPAAGGSMTSSLRNGDRGGRAGAGFGGGRYSTGGRS
jgi:hypothetical protein